MNRSAQFHHRVSTILGRSNPSLVVTRIGRVPVAIPTRSRRSRRSRLVAPEPALLSSRCLAVHLNVLRSWVAGESIRTRLRVVLLAAPPLAAAAPGVAVGWGGAESLLALVVAGEQDLEEDGDGEEEAVGYLLAFRETLLVTSAA